MWDFSLPRYKYLGPGNRLDKGQANNYNDEVAFKHDKAYVEYIRHKYNPYLKYSKADEEARNKFTNDDYGGTLGKAFFGIKKFAWESGVIGDTGDIKKSKRLREPPTIDPVDKKRARRTNPPLANLQTSRHQTAALNSMPADGKGSNNDAGLTETPIDNPHDVHRGPPDYTFASLPWMVNKKFLDLRTFGVDMAWRMTSPYDPEVTTTVASTTGTGGLTTFWNPAAAEPDALTANKARWFNYYAGLYKYYHVISCRYKVFIENLSGEPAFAHVMFYNDIQPPTNATNEDIMLWQGVKTKYLTTHYKAINPAGYIDSAETTFNPSGLVEENEGQGDTGGTTNYRVGNMVASTIGSPVAYFSGEYKPGQFKREIIRDADVENWTGIGTNPVLTERLLVRIKPESSGLNAVSQRGDMVHFKIRVELSYLVEFKELQDNLKWPVSRQPLTVTIDAQGNTTV